MTYKHGNIQDLAIVESASDVKMSNLKRGHFLSDHCVVFGELNLPKPYILDKPVKYRNLRKANTEGIIDKLCLNELCEMDCMLEEFWNKFQTRLKACLDKFVPEKTSKQPLRDSMPWYNQELRLMKYRVSNHEKVWQKYKEEHQWSPYKAVRNEYNWKIRLAWTKYMKDQICKLKRDIKGLYKLIVKLTGLTSEK